MPDHTDDLTDDPTDGHGAGDDELATRIRGALDDRAAPVTLDEVVGRTGRTGSAAAAEPAATAVNGSGSSDEDAPDERVIELAPAEPARRRPVLLAAAAVLVLLLGAGLLAARDRSDDLDVGNPPVAPDSSFDGAPGGIYDPASGVLDHKGVGAMAADADGHLYLAYTDSSDVDPTDATELLNQADALGEEVASIEAEIAAHPDAPENEALRQEAAGLRDRQTELRLQASQAKLQTRVDGAGYHFGMLVVDAFDGSVLADNELPATVRPDSIAAVGSTTWFATEGDPADNQLWVGDGSGAVRSVDGLPAPMAITASPEGLWLRGAGALQLRDPVDGTLRETSTVTELAHRGAVATGDGGTWTTGWQPDEVRSVEGVALGAPVAVPDEGFANRRLLVAGGSVFVVDTTTIKQVDAASGTLRATQSTEGGAVMGIAAGGDRFWAAAQDLDPSTALQPIVVIDGQTGEVRAFEVAVVGQSANLAVLPDGDAVLCASATRVDGEAAFGSDCRRVASPFGSGGQPTGSTAPKASTVPPPTVSTVVPEIEPVPTTTEPPAGVSLNPRGISLAGLDPVRLGMTAAELALVTDDRMSVTQGRCGSQGVEEEPAGPVDVRLMDGVVTYVDITEAGFTTAEGAEVGMAVADLVGLYPDLDHRPFDAEPGRTNGQYALRSADSAIYLTYVDDTVTSITVSVVTQGWIMDLC